METPPPNDAEPNVNLNLVSLSQLDLTPETVSRKRVNEDRSENCYNCRPFSWDKALVHLGYSVSSDYINRKIIFNELATYGIHLVRRDDLVHLC